LPRGAVGSPASARRIFSDQRQVDSALLPRFLSHMTAAQIASALLVPLVLWRLYRWVRRGVGRRLLRPRQLIAYIVLLAVAVVAVVVFAEHSPLALGAEFGGLAAGIACAWVGVRLTRFELAPEGAFYTPNATLGAALVLLLIGGAVFRVSGWLLAPSTATESRNLLHCPIVLLLFGLTAGYYLSYSASILARGRKVA
jgi:hypothetical protein